MLSSNRSQLRLQNYSQTADSKSEEIISENFLIPNKEKNSNKSLMNVDNVPGKAITTPKKKYICLNFSDNFGIENKKISSFYKQSGTNKYVRNY